ncbi:MAG: type II toxin-antitoxin system prevent-host-death family antitoxin [Candidatus Electrothrix sp. LOE2]|nr:type II toxin-antitoxin system prevent-host-death family antitoxin [Candidatus Electrothrix sp. LOE2]
METIGAYAAKTHLPKLLNRVSRGEKIIITKHGVPVASLQPPESATTRQKQMPIKKIIAELRKFRCRHKLNGLSIREMIEEGRR